MKVNRLYNPIALKPATVCSILFVGRGRRKVDGRNVVD